MARRLTDARVLEVAELRAGIAIRTTSYVGRLRLGDLEVTIHPKIGELRVLRFLRYGLGLRSLRLFEPLTYDIEAEPFPDLIIRQLAAEAAELVSRGLHRTYVRTDEALASPRGRINVEAIARRGRGNDATLPCTHYPRTQDALVNRVLLTGLHVAATLTEDLALRATLRRLAAGMADGVSTARLDRATFLQLHRSANRLTAAYRPALSLIEMLATSRGVTLDDDPSMVMLPGFLFDMNRLFQAVLSRFLRENLFGSEVRDEQKLVGAMAYVPGYNPRNRPAPAPRPDFLVSTGSRVTALLDAKYIDLWEHPIGRDILYQLAIYAMSREDDRTATILYPTTDGGATEARIAVRDPVGGGTRAQVVARPVPIDRLEALLEHTGTAAQRERATFARWLAFGSQPPPG